MNWISFVILSDYHCVIYYKQRKEDLMATLTKERKIHWKFYQESRRNTRNHIQEDYQYSRLVYTESVWRSDLHIREDQVLVLVVPYHSQLNFKGTSCDPRGLEVGTTSMFRISIKFSISTFISARFTLLVLWNWLVT